MKTIKPLFASCLLLVCFLFIQCDSTEILTEPTEKPYISKEKISINSLLKTIQNPSILKETETFKSRTQENILEKSGKKTDTYFTKIVKGNEYTTYLLLVNSYSAKKPYFMYYVITERDGIEKAGYIKYIPDAPKVSLDFNAFSGKIKMLDIKQKTKSESRFLNGQPYKKAESTTSKTVEYCTTTITYISHNCTNGGNHSLGETCGVGVNDAYYEFTGFDQDCYSSGYDNSGPVPNEFMNTSDGMGGGGPNTDIEVVAFEQLLNPEQKLWWDNPLNDANRNVFITYLKLNPTDEAKESASQIISQIMFDKTREKFDVVASLYSPMNIITSTIDSTTTEGKKFNEIYNALLNAPEFKKLFVDIFKDSKRDNVKFEIDDHVFEDNDPTKKEVNATTSYDPVTKNLIIKISKQILIAGTTKSQTKIENAKTILHECIHAYLFVKANYPATGVDFVKILNSMYPNDKEQHDFMYDHMIPTMQKVLTEIRDAVTTQAGRSKAEERIMYTTLTPLTSTPWNWNDYYKYVSLKGLEETSSFKIDFPKYSDRWNLLGNYINYGHDDLQP